MYNFFKKNGYNNLEIIKKYLPLHPLLEISRIVKRKSRAVMSLKY